jgi:hypothetical protein
VFKWLASNWERILFSALGLTFIYFSLTYIQSKSLAESSAAFGMGFLCFIFSSVSRFKRFKGLGFEAELWEDKQREAVELIERLKDIVTLYSKEVVMNRVTSNRWGGRAGGWTGHWKLFDELTGQHQALGQKIDFSDLKKEVDAYFLLDLVNSQFEAIQRPITEGRSAAQAVIAVEFVQPIADAAAYDRRLQQLKEIGIQFPDMFDLAQQSNLAEEVLKWAEESKRKLAESFGVDIGFDDTALGVLREIATACQRRPITVTDRLTSIADRME